MTSSVTSEAARALRKVFVGDDISFRVSTMMLKMLPMIPKHTTSGVRILSHMNITCSRYSGGIDGWPRPAVMATVVLAAWVANMGSIVDIAWAIPSEDMTCCAVSVMLASMVRIYSLKSGVPFKNIYILFIKSVYL